MTNDSKLSNKIKNLIQTYDPYMVIRMHYSPYKNGRFATPQERAEHPFPQAVREVIAVIEKTDPELLEKNYHVPPVKIQELLSKPMYFYTGQFSYPSQPELYHTAAISMQADKNIFIFDERTKNLPQEELLAIAAHEVKHALQNSAVRSAGEHLNYFSFYSFAATVVALPIVLTLASNSSLYTDSFAERALFNIPNIASILSAWTALAISRHDELDAERFALAFNPGHRKMDEETLAVLREEPLRQKIFRDMCMYFNTQLFSHIVARSSNLTHPHRVTNQEILAMQRGELSENYWYNRALDGLKNMVEKIPGPDLGMARGLEKLRVDTSPVKPLR